MSGLISSDQTLVFSACPQAEVVSYCYNHFLSRVFFLREVDASFLVELAISLRCVVRWMQHAACRMQYEQ